jgi:hypothetical protein
VSTRVESGHAVDGREGSAKISPRIVIVAWTVPALNADTAKSDSDLLTLTLCIWVHLLYLRSALVVTEFREPTSHLVPDHTDQKQGMRILRMKLILRIAP